jgi:hypothetical protein
MHEALGPIPSTEKKKIERKKILLSSSDLE